MLVLVRCPSCGFCLGDYAEAYQALRRERVEAALGAKQSEASAASFCDGLQVDCSDLLAEIGCGGQLCCCAALTTTDDFSSRY